MATHNQVRIVGYISEKPNVHRDRYGIVDRIILGMTAVRRDIQGYGGNRLTMLNITYNGKDQAMLDQLSSLKQFDIIDVKGVVEIINANRRSECPNCMEENEAFTTLLTVFPQFVYKLGSYAQAQDISRLSALNPESASFLESSPEFNLIRRYKEVSNQALLIGTVITKPQLVEDEKTGAKFCRYMIGVDRKFVLDRSEDSRKAADYPWVYTYGRQAEEDAKRLKGSQENEAGSRVFVEAAVSTEKVEKHWKCANCGQEYTTEVNGSKLIAYSVEYLSNYLTKEDENREEGSDLISFILAGSGFE